MYIPSFHLVSRAAAACTGTTYTIAAGDTCSTIATKNGVTISDLVVQNQDICGGANQNLLQVGTAVCIVPGAGVNAGPTIVADALNTAAYTALQPCTGHVDIVLGGATCTTIAAKYNVTLAALMAVAIPGQCAKLEAADAICVPGTATTSLTVGGAALPAGQAVIPAVIPPVASATPPVVNAAPATTTCTGTVYSIAAGDTCSTIATKNGATISDLVVLNQDICGGANQNLLQLGTKICIVPGAGANMGPTIVADALNTAAYIAVQPCITGHVDIVLGGATCTAIAAKYGVGLDVLMAGTIPGQCAKLEAADAICVPGAAIAPVTGLQAVNPVASAVPVVSPNAATLAASAIPPVPVIPVSSAVPATNPAVSAASVPLAPSPLAVSSGQILAPTTPASSPAAAAPATPQAIPNAVGSPCTTNAGYACSLQPDSATNTAAIVQCVFGSYIHIDNCNDTPNNACTIINKVPYCVAGTGIIGSPGGTAAGM